MRIILTDYKKWDLSTNKNNDYTKMIIQLIKTMKMRIIQLIKTMIIRKWELSN